MLRQSVLMCWGAVLALLLSSSVNAAVKGHYIEVRTCQVYTGPCFANGETALTGKDAVMAWKINEGQQAGVSLEGLHVVVILRASDTLGFQGLNSADEVKSMIVVDEKATPQQRAALVGFARRQTGQQGDSVKTIVTAPIDLNLDTFELTGQVKAGKYVDLQTRKARPDDCICSNESAYYPPLARLEHFAPGVTISGSVKGRKLGSSWSTENDRNAYMATFDE